MNASGESDCAYGAGVLLRHLQAMLVEEPGVRRGQDLEHIHRMRVASRRLRAALPLFESCFPARKTAAWGKALRRVTRSLGEARDVDVQIEALQKFLAATTMSQFIPGMRRLQVRWSQQRMELQKDVLKALDEMRESRIFEKMGTALLPFTLGVEPGAPPSHSLYQLSEGAISARLAEFLSFEPFISQPEKVAELHQMRIAAKRLRYTLETFASLYPDGLSGKLTILRAAQELLGDIHDCDVWSLALPRFLEEEKQRVIEFYGVQGPLNLLLPGVNAFMEDRLAVRSEKYQTFLRKWQNWKEKGTWAELSRITSAPLINSAALYPPPASALPQSEEDNDG